ncbi:serine/threonine protein kinase [bacterium]|nr:serine/threonine protein kinase [bacterium]
MSVTVQCPNCGAGVPIPRIQRDGGEARVRCRVCNMLLAIHRPSNAPRRSDAVMSFGEGIRVPGYELLGVLGKGGMGMVFSAVRLSDEQLVAIKVLPPECAAHPELVNRFDLEAQMMATLSHPNIVPILDRGRISEHYFIVVDYIPGCTLKDRIGQAAPLKIDEISAIATPVSEAIQSCHELGLVHRDLKPANILLSQDGRVLVTDFGIANLIQRLGDQTEDGVMIGTPQYVAPEQLRDGSKVGFAADQYSLAVIIYEMLTGMLPMGVFEPPSKMCPELTPEAETVLLRALSRDASKRYPSMRQFMRAFRRSLKRPADVPPPEVFVHAAAMPVLAGGGDDSPKPSGDVDVSVLEGEETPSWRRSPSPVELRFFGDSPRPRPGDEEPVPITPGPAHEGTEEDEEYSPKPLHLGPTPTPRLGPQRPDVMPRSDTQVIAVAAAIAILILACLAIAIILL